jgi:hypothetical protein
MGLYDDVKMEKIYCPWCGYKIENEYWQSKAAYDSNSAQSPFLNKYESLEQFGTEVYDVFNINLINSCSECHEYIDLNVTNDSSRAVAYRTAQIKEVTDSFKHEQEREHPNHKAAGCTLTGTHITWSNGWCDLCKKDGISNGDLNPGADPEFVAEESKRIRHSVQGATLWDKSKNPKN